jgi:hypothetical protein
MVINYTLLVIFFNQKVGSILNPIRKASLSIWPTTFRTIKKEKNTYSTKEVKGIKINLDLIFNNFPLHCTDLRLVILIVKIKYVYHMKNKK